MSRHVNLDEFINGPLKQGPAYTDMYCLSFYRNASNISDKESTNVGLLCRDVNYPSYLLNLGSLNNRVLGENELKYPYSETKNDLEATFMVDRQLSTLKYFYKWHTSIFDNERSFSIDAGSGIRTGITGLTETKRFNYPDNYKSTAILEKIERGSNIAILTGAVYFKEIYPYARDISLMSYKKTDVMEVTMRFAYTDHFELYS